MEEFMWIFFIILAVVVVVVRMWLKAFSSPKPADNRPTTPRAYPVPTPPATSYQDILKEMQASGDRAKNSSTPTLIESKGSAEKERREAKSLENTEIKVRSLETRVVPTKEVIRKPSTIEVSRQTKPRVAVSATPTVNYGKLLQDPKNMRAAFILSEILTRRVDY